MAPIEKLEREEKEEDLLAPRKGQCPDGPNIIVSASVIQGEDS